MTQAYPDYIWQNGAIKPWAEATVHVMAHALHYGSSIFEGIRSYDTPGGAKIFRLTDHLKRLEASAKIYEMQLPYDIAAMAKACRDVIAANGFGAAYLRPVAYRGLGGFGLSAETPIDVAVASWKMGSYLGAGVLEAGIDACVSSWQRFAPNTIPAGAKAGGNYLSGTLIAREARRLGFGEGIALASTGLLSEGAGRTCSWSSMAPCTPRRSALPCSMASPATRSCAWPATTASKWSSATCPANTSTCATSCSCVARPPRSPRSAPWTAARSAPASADR